MQILYRLIGLLRLTSFNSRMDEEMQHHLEMATAKKIREGCAPDEARRLALVEFGARQRFREEVRDEFRNRPLGDLAGDVRLALRTLRRNRSFALVVILTLAIGIGANTALFSVYDRLILHPVTMPDPDSLLAIVTSNPQVSSGFVPSVAWTRFEEIRHASTFTSMGISAFDTFTMTGSGDPLQLNGVRVSATFFPTLGILPAQGRNFTQLEDAPNGPLVCVISHEFWQSRLGGAAGVVGSVITLNGQPWEVIGIMPPRLTPPYGQYQVFAPRVFEVGNLTPLQIQNGASYGQPIARLKPGVTLDQARAELAALSRSYRERFGGKLDAANTTEAQTLVSVMAGGLQATFYTLLAAVGFVLLIACGNAASLCLGRLVTRHKELALRRALGATKGRVMRLFLVESLVCSFIAGVLGLISGYWALSAIQSLLSSQIPPNTVFTLNTRAFLFTAGITLATALLVGIVPALNASRASIGDALKDSARGSSSERAGKFRSALIVSEVALSVVLLTGSSLLLISFLQLQRTPGGFEPKGVGAAFVGISTNQYKVAAQQVEFFTQVIERLHARPDVTGAAVALGLPLSGFNPRSPYSVDGRPILPLPQRPLAGLAVVSEDYFSLLHIPFVEGRAFTVDDRAGAPNVCIVNESLSKKLFPEESALGKVLLRGANAEVRNEIVGVIHDVKTFGLNVPAPDEIYFPMRQLPRPNMAIVARTDGDPTALQNAIREAVTSVDKNQPISFFSTMESSVALSLGTQQIVATLTVIFAAFAVLLSAVGLYSVLAYAVSRRASEIGIRMALGAQRQEVVVLVMRSGLKLVLAGLVIGLLSSAGAASLIQKLLFNVQPLDLRVYGGVALLFLAIAALACLLPSMRASRIDPLSALRSE